MKKSLWIILYLFLPIVMVPCVTYGQSDLFEIKTPNVMIIFDSSSSMERDTSGLTVTGQIWPWIRMEDIPPRKRVRIPTGLRLGEIPPLANSILQNMRSGTPSKTLRR